jgi:hypothetical protein
MSTLDAVLEAAWVLNPRSVQRARRLALAVQLLRQRCGVGQPEAWRIVDMASDMATRQLQGDTQ